MKRYIIGDKQQGRGNTDEIPIAPEPAADKPDYRYIRNLNIMTMHRSRSTCELSIQIYFGRNPGRSDRTNEKLEKEAI